MQLQQALARLLDAEACVAKSAALGKNFYLRLGASWKALREIGVVYVCSSILWSLVTCLGLVFYPDLQKNL